jgi:hypothetical protein
MDLYRFCVDGVRESIPLLIPQSSEYGDIFINRIGKRHAITRGEGSKYPTRTNRGENLELSVSIVQIYGFDLSGHGANRVFVIARDPIDCLAKFSVDDDGVMSRLNANDQIVFFRPEPSIRDTTLAP